MIRTMCDANSDFECEVRVSESQRRIRVLWTATAKEQLKGLPTKVQRGLLDKADELAAASDPRRVHKPLTGPLKNYFRMTYARYRAVYSVTEDELVDGNVLVTFTVHIIACGKREEHSKDDVYKVVEKLAKYGLLDTSRKSIGPR